MATAYVCSGATMKCSMGDAQAMLTVLPSRMIYLCNKPKANISDFQPLVNIAPFGLCRSLANPVVAAATAANLGRLTPMPCIPNTQAPWIPGKLDVIEQGQLSLLSDCKLMCTWAGVIEFITNGQI